MQFLLKISASLPKILACPEAGDSNATMHDLGSILAPFLLNFGYIFALGRGLPFTLPLGFIFALCCFHFRPILAPFQLSLAPFGLHVGALSAGT